MNAWLILKYDVKKWVLSYNWSHL